MSAMPAENRIDQLYRDCRDLARYIARARGEIAQLRPGKMKAEKLPRAGQELEAIVKGTEEATHSIMEAAEEIMNGEPGSNPDEYKTKVDDACMRIFEACSFQDITGQRVNKVVTTIKYVEERLNALQSAWGPDLSDDPDEEEVLEGEAALLNGPALEGEGVRQDDVDAILGNSAGKDPNQPNNQADIDALFD